MLHSHDSTGAAAVAGADDVGRKAPGEVSVLSAGEASRTSPREQQLHLVRRLVTSCTGGWLQPGDTNHTLSVDFILSNLAQPGSLPPTERGVGRLYTGCVALPPPPALLCPTTLTVSPVTWLPWLYTSVLRRVAVRASCGTLRRAACLRACLPAPAQLG